MSDDEVVPIPEMTDDLEDGGGAVDPESYKDATYYGLPENVRKAIDLAKSRSKHSGFYDKLKNVSDKVGVFTSVFYTRMPKFERQYIDRKRRRLEVMVLQEQKAIEEIVAAEKRKANVE